MRKIRAKKLIYIYMVSPQCDSSYDLENWQYVKMPSHTDCIYIFSPVWILVWLIRLYCLLKTVNILSHWRHWYGFSTLWVLWWITRFCVSLKAFIHRLHLNGLSPVCVFRWLIRVPLVISTLPQWLHRYGFSPVCVHIWCIRYYLRKPCHTGCIDMVSPQCESLSDL